LEKYVFLVILLVFMREELARDYLNILSLHSLYRSPSDSLSSSSNIIPSF